MTGIDAVGKNVDIRGWAPFEQFFPFAIASDGMGDASLEQPIFGVLNQFRGAFCRDLLRPVAGGFGIPPHHFRFNIVPIDDDRWKSRPFPDDWQVLHQVNPFHLRRIELTRA